MSEMREADQLNGAALAYVGDAVYEVYVRQAVIAAGLTQPNRLHRAATKYVSAQGQAYVMQQLRDSDRLSDAELEIYKRGRNHKANTKAKNASIGAYRQATGFEALIGWLHLTEQTARAEALMAEALALIDERGQQNEI